MVIHFYKTCGMVRFALQRANHTFATILTALLAFSTLQAAEIGLSFSNISASNCVNGDDQAIVAGSKALIIVRIVNARILPDGPGLFPESKPSWITIECGHITEDDQFIRSLDLESQLSPTYFMDETQEITNNLVATGQEVSPLLRLQLMYFSLDIPEALVGEQICVVPRIVSAPFEVTETQGAGTCRYVAAPCTYADTVTIFESHIKVASMSRLPELAVSLADSAMGIGLRAPMLDAELAANRLKRFEKALQIFDYRFETLGWAVPKIGDANYTPEDELVRYQYVRENMLRVISEQERSDE